MSNAKQKALESQFNLIVNTLLSKDTNPAVIQQYVRQYAENAGVTYTLAREAITLKVKDIIIRRLETL